MVKKNAVLLAAGDGKRMRSLRPKVLLEVLFEPMLEWTLSACESSGIEEICVVTGHASDEVEDYLQHREWAPDVRYVTVLQSQRRGTGHAVMQAGDFLRQTGGDTLVLCGDAPFLDKETIDAAYEAHQNSGAAVTVISAVLEEPYGYGRILRDENGALAAIVEERDATDEQRAIREVNSGAYWCRTKTLPGLLDKLESGNAQGEYYFTDSVALAIREGLGASAFATDNSAVALGANDRKGLFALHEFARLSIIERLLEEGVSFESLEGVQIGRHVRIGEDTVIRMGTVLRGKTIIGTGCVLGPNTWLQNCSVGYGCQLNSVQGFDSVLHANVKAGPFVHIRPGSSIAKGVKIGDFVEVKNSSIGEGTAIAHLTYVGDSDVGSHVNFGCGVVTVNYDGANKHRTTIGDGAFIGCNTNLVAPVKVGNGAYTAAGTTVTRDVPDDALVIERGEEKIKEGFAKRKLKKKHGG